MGFAGAFRRAELVALTVADLVEAPDGYRVMIRRSKTYAALAGLDPALFAGHSLRSGFLTSSAEAGASVLKRRRGGRSI